MRHRALLLVLLSGWLAGCFDPEYGDVSFACSVEGACPDGYECGLDLRCRRADRAPLPDGAPGSGNDVCVNATLLVEGMEVVGHINDAADDAQYSCGAGKDRFYAFTLAEPRHVTVTVGSTLDVSTVLLSGDCLDEYTCIDDTMVGEQLVEENLPAGAYVVAVESDGGGSGQFTIGYTTAEPIVRPANDRCDGARLLEDGVPLTAQTVDSARDDASGSCASAEAGDVVYTFEISGENQRARITVDGADFDPALILQGDTCGGPELDCAQFTSGDSEVLDATDLAPGSYYLWVDEIGDAGSTFDIQLDLLAAVPAPGNDMCSGSAPLAEGVWSAGTTLGAANDHVLACLSSDTSDTVHDFTLGATRAVLVSVAPVGGWRAAATLLGADCEGGASVACVADGTSTRYINRKSVAAGDYHVIVDGAGGATGAYQIRYDTRSPDSTFGYWRVDATGTYEPLTTYTEIALEHGVDGDDESHFLVDIGFDFPFYGQTKEQVNIGSNGYLTFDAPPVDFAEAYDNDCPLTIDAVPGNLIAVFWDDLFPPATQTARLRHHTEGSAPNRRFIVEWTDWDIFESAPCSGQGCFATGALVTHQAILHENGDIELRYGPRTAPADSNGCGSEHTGCSATIGLRDAAGTDSDMAQCDIATVSAGKVVYYVYPN